MIVMYVDMVCCDDCVQPTAVNNSSSGIMRRYRRG